MSYFTKRYHPPGTPPGTLVEQEAKTKTPLKISLVNYTASSITETDLTSLSECIPYLNTTSNTWIHLQGDPEIEQLQMLAEQFGLHSLSLEDVLNTGQRPKVDSFDEQLFIIMSLPVMDGNNVSTEQISLFVGDRYVISFHRGKTDPFKRIRDRLQKNTNKVRSQGTDYLMYTLIDAVIDEGFPVLEDFGDLIELLEEELLESPDQETLRKIHELKRELIMLRRMLWPQREVLNILIRDAHPSINSGTYVYLRDCYDHTIQMMDLIETYRDMSASMLDIYLSSVSNRMNEVMKVLTIIATIFIPLTFITSLYGMNFSNPNSPWAMPELRWYFGYPLIWLVMIATTVGMVIFFKRKKWF
jgi:magnesium transporter